MNREGVASLSSPWLQLTLARRGAHDKTPLRLASFAYLASHILIERVTRSEASC